MASPRRICIFLTGGIGDFVTAVPAMLRLRQAFPRSRIALVGNPLWLPLARESRIADQTHAVDDLPLHAGFVNDLPADHPLSRFLDGFDLIVSWFGDREGQWERTLRRRKAGKVVVRPFHRIHAFQGHASEYYFTTLDALGLSEGDGHGPGRVPSLRVLTPGFPETHRRGAKRTDSGPFLCLHPGSGSEKKNWPKESFLEVARGAFRLWGLPSTVLLGPAEEGQRIFWTKTREPYLSVKKGLAIPEVARLLHSATLYVGNDSGITHLAAALDIPVVALFGPTDPSRWAPMGLRVEILRQPISPQDALAALGRFYSSIIL
jgi:ADP-heptose:LPS heptosyltransferase